MTPQTRNWPRQLTPPQLAKLEWIQAQLKAGKDLHLTSTSTLDALVWRELITMSYAGSKRDEAGVVCRDPNGKPLLKTLLAARGEETIKNGGFWR